MAVAVCSTHLGPNTREAEAGGAECKAIPDCTVKPCHISHKAKQRPRPSCSWDLEELSPAAPLAETSKITETSVFHPHFKVTNLQVIREKRTPRWEEKRGIKAT